MNGLPEPEIAGNVMVPFVDVKFSLRMPPTLDPDQAMKSLENLLLNNVPYNAKAKILSYRIGKGWNSPGYDEYLEKLISEASL